MLGLFGNIVLALSSNTVRALFNLASPAAAPCEYLFDSSSILGAPVAFLPPGPLASLNCCGCLASSDAACLTWAMAFPVPLAAN